jgi:hypothetical protein
MRVGGHTTNKIKIQLILGTKSVSNYTFAVNKPQALQRILKESKGNSFSKIQNATLNA